MSLLTLINSKYLRITLWRRLCGVNCYIFLMKFYYFNDLTNSVLQKKPDDTVDIWL